MIFANLRLTSGATAVNIKKASAIETEGAGRDKVTGVGENEVTDAGEDATYSPVPPIWK